MISFIQKYMGILGQSANIFPKPYPGDLNLEILNSKIRAAKYLNYISIYWYL